MTYIEAISAMDRTTKNIPTQTTRNIQIPPAVPPFIRERATIPGTESEHNFEG
jgi:hypothetical protein